MLGLLMTSRSRVFPDVSRLPLPLLLCATGVVGTEPRGVSHVTESSTSTPDVNSSPPRVHRDRNRKYQILSEYSSGTHQQVCLGYM